MCAVVARSGGDNTVLSRYSTTVGNFNEVVSVVLNRIAAEPAGISKVNALKLTKKPLDKS